MSPHSSAPQFRLLAEATDTLVDWARIARREAHTPFEAAQQLVSRLGVHSRNGVTEAGFWAPELVEQEIPVADVHLELLTPREPIDLRRGEQQVRFRRDLLPLVQDGEYLWGAISGMQPGSREQIGTFYRVRYRDVEGAWQVVPDYLAYSLPFGSFAPAEYYDVDRMQAGRADREHFAHLNVAPDPDGMPRVQAPTNILQLHVGTASAGGTLAGLARVYEEIARKVRAGEALAPGEEVYVGYDAVQLMPIAPTIEYESGPGFWHSSGEPSAGTITVTLRRPDMTNWGYDVPLFAMSAINPALLESGRPDELVDFIAALHNFPGRPIEVIFDVVYGHIDNQALPLLNEHFFASAGMYGQNVNFQDPVVRALLLEMQRRKHNYGVDGVRVDGAQDFKYWDAQEGVLRHDDAYLSLMNDVVQEVAGERYRPWMIFEDGRPWPRTDWELASTYREITKQYPNVFQWGPLTFAHNTPFLFTFWISKGWRIREIKDVGSHWITGCANHDTLRRGTQVDTDARINTYLGDTLPEIFQRAYDNPAATLFDYALMPGVPMDFINASMGAPWSFVRNTDDRYGVKVVSEESRFLYWIVDDALFARRRSFPRLKALGFTELGELRRFMHTLDHLVQATDYRLESIVEFLNHATPPLSGRPFSIAGLKKIARAWMDDVHELCNVSYYAGGVDAEHARFNRSVREFRRARPWLMEDFKAGEHFDYLYPVDGTVLFYGLRRAPANDEAILFVANMEGEPRTVTPLGLPVPNLPRQGWRLALAAPGLEDARADRPLTLHDSQGAVFVTASGVQS